MIGDYFRLRSWTAYGQKLPKGQPGIISQSFKANPGKHVVVVVIGEVRDSAEIDDEYVKAQLNLLQSRILKGE
jgi:hypothetical protein